VRLPGACRGRSEPPADLRAGRRVVRVAGPRLSGRPRPTVSVGSGHVRKRPSRADTLVCVGPRAIRPLGAGPFWGHQGDWLSGRALRSHRRGRWFEPSIAHQIEAQVRDSMIGLIPPPGMGPQGWLTRWLCFAHKVGTLGDHSGVTASFITCCGCGDCAPPPTPIRGTRPDSRPCRMRYAPDSTTEPPSRMLSRTGPSRSRLPSGERTNDVPGRVRTSPGAAQRTFRP
jgi:hypothetical protein